MIPHTADLASKSTYAALLAAAKDGSLSRAISVVAFGVADGRIVSVDVLVQSRR